MNFQEGEIISIDKPYKMSSFGALAHVRYVLSKRLGVRRLKMGHAGTLDPLATGVLILCTGRMTKKIEEIQQQTKEYYATLQLGATTPSYDMEHDVDAHYPTDHINRELIISALDSFVGEIDQIPPAYSAVKVDGKRAYELKRKGKDIELKPKKIKIYEIELISYDQQAQSVQIRVVCGKGTYIRSLARDIGEKLSSGAYLTALRRTRVGDINVADCIPFDNVREWVDNTLNQTPNNN